LTLANIRKVLSTVTLATSAGAAQNPAGAVDIEALLGRAFDGMDAARLQAVQEPATNSCVSIRAFTARAGVICLESGAV
jgi:hypothetical protein